MPSIPVLRGVLLSSVFALALPAAAPAQQHFAADEDLELMLRYLVEDGETPGIVLGIREADGSTRILSYGEAGSEARPLGPRSAFEIGSITKTFTGTLLADMVARGEVALDDPVRKHLPAGVTIPSRNGREITLLDLATHRSGLPRMPDNFDPADPENPYADYTDDQLYEFLSGHELRRDPGAEAEYSNLGMGLLGHVLERVSGQAYEALVRERILEPLGMERTGIVLEGELAGWMTRGHNPIGEVVPYWDVITLAGAGGLRSNAEDMLLYLDANLGPPESDIERAMREAQRPRARLDEDASIGLAWVTREYGDRRIVSHGGGTAGFSTLMAFDPRSGVGFVRLTNTGEFQDDIAMDFLRRGPPLDIPEVELSRDVLERYVGAYRPGSRPPLYIRMEDEGWLTMQVPGNVRFRMYAESDTSFFVKRTPWRLRFRSNEAGEVTGVALDLEGTPLQATRVEAEMADARAVAGNAIPDLALSEEEMAPYVGVYEVPLPSGTIEATVYVEDGKLMVRPDGSRASRLLYQGGHEFVVVTDPDDRVVFELEGDRAVTLILHDDGREIRGERIP